MNKLVIILGAGFSRPIGLPLARDIIERFDRDQRGQLLNFSSGEWMWADGKNDVDKHNGSLFPESTVYSYILNEVIKEYKVQKGCFDNYELFYQWIHNISSNHSLKNEIYEKAKTELLRDYPSIENYSPEYDGDIHPYLYRFENDSNFSNLLDIVNYLIADLLGFSQSQFHSSIPEYSPFINYLKKYEEVDIFTLNHDLLLENLFEYFGINYSRGFTKENSEIRYQDKNTPISVFKDSFVHPIRIHKLHGSLDFFRFEHFEQGEKIYLEPTGKYNYFSTRNYREKHFAIRVNPETGETIQDLNFDIVPKFITGINKTKIIENDLMYTELFSRFEQRMSEAPTVLISGYSFGDEHLNKVLKKRRDVEIINQNPSVNYPFQSNRISNIQALKHLSL